MRSRRLYRLVNRAKRFLPAGAPFDNSLNYISAWNWLEYRPNLAEPRSLNELFFGEQNGNFVETGVSPSE